MSRVVLVACVPWLALLLLSFGTLFLLARASRARLELGRLRQLHADQVGTAQSLSFVLALPLFIMVLLFIVQVSQLMIGQIVVEYAAVAAARAAVVWIPSYLVDGNGDIEEWNRIGSETGAIGYTVDEAAVNQPYSLSGPTNGGITYKLTGAGDKYQKIRMAAALACVPISPSRDCGMQLDGQGSTIVPSLAKVYTAMTGGSAADARLRNKLAYTLFQNPVDPTQDILTVDVQFYHSNQEFPLIQAWNPIDGSPGIPPDYTEFLQDHEVGWQDPVTVTVKYNLALLPGPGRLLARSVVSPGGGPDAVSSQITNRGGGLYVYPLTATATLGMEGEKPNYAHYLAAPINP